MPATGPTPENKTARAFLTLVNPPEGYFVPEGVDAQGVKLSEAAEAWYKNFKAQNPGLSNEALADKLVEQLKSLSIHKDGATVPPDLKNNLVAILNNSPDAAAFGQNIANDATRNGLWAQLTAEVNGQKVDYFQNRYGTDAQIRELQNAFGPFMKGLERVFSFSVQNPYEQAKSAEIQAFQEAFLDEDERPLPAIPDDADDAYIAGVAAQVFTKIKGTYQIDAADVAAEAAAKTEIARIIKSDEWKNASRHEKAKVMADMFRTFAESHPDIKAPTEGIDRDDFVNGGHLIKAPDGTVMFDMDPAKAFKNIDELNAHRRNSGLEDVRVSEHSYKTFPGMSA